MVNSQRNSKLSTGSSYDASDWMDTVIEEVDGGSVLIKDDKDGRGAIM